MKIKVIAALAVAAAVMMPAAAFAAEEYQDNYNAQSNALENIDANGLKTVMIVKVDSESDTSITESDIVYIDQNESGFNSAASFMLKATPAAGLYRVYLGGDWNDPTTGYFSIEAQDIKTEDAVTIVNNTIEKTAEDGSKLYDRGFTAELKAGDKYNSIKLVHNGTTVGVWSVENEIPNITGEAAVNFGIEVLDIPEEYKDLSVYMSADTVTNTAGQ